VPNNWNNLPVITKQNFQTGLNEWLARGYTKNNVFLNSTSGSSGIPFKFAKDREAHALTWALIEQRYQVIGINVFRDFEARFYGIPISPYSKYLKERVKDFIAKRLRFPVFNLEDDVLETYYLRFTKNPFVYLNGYTSSLVAFAEYILRKKQKTLKQVCPSLKVCITTSEMCSRSDREIIEKAFGIKVVNEYGAAELDIIAIEDAEGDWVLNEESLFIEVVGDDNQPVENGSEGKIIVTSLYNKAMPFIRYELGDRGIISNRTKGPYRILEGLTGRTNDIAELPSGRKIPGLTFYYVTKALLKEEGLIKEIVVKQEAPDSFLILYSGARDLNESEKNNVRDLLSTYMEPGLKLRIERVEKIIRQPSGKLKQFERVY
jgi:phenylacetate-CoA ligase